MTIKQLLDERFGGIIHSSCHTPNGQACILELRSQWMGIEWTDDPILVDTFDIRPLNDAQWSSDEQRTKYMLKLEKAVGGSLNWSKKRQKKFVKIVVLETVRKIISSLPGLSPEVRKQCKSASTLAEAANAGARAAWVVEAVEAVRVEAALAAALAAARAARAAAAEAEALAAERTADKFLTKAVNIWVRAAKESL